MSHDCHVCDETFNSWWQREIHVAQDHDVVWERVSNYPRQESER